MKKERKGVIGRTTTQKRQRKEMVCMIVNYEPVSPKKNTLVS